MNRKTYTNVFTYYWKNLIILRNEAYLFCFSKVDDPNGLIVKKKEMFDQIYEKVTFVRCLDCIVLRSKMAYN